MREIYRGPYLGTADQALPASPNTDAVDRRTQAAYLSLRQVARPHRLLGKIEPHRGNTVEQSHIDATLREIATLHARMHDLPAYLGSSIAYDESGFWVHGQLRAGNEADQARVHSEREPLVRDFDRRMKALPVETTISRNFVPDGKEAVFGPAVFENFFAGAVTYLGDLLPNREDPRKAFGVWGDPNFPPNKAAREWVELRERTKPEQP